MYAAGACRAACRMLRPPKEDGREALSQAQSGSGPPARSERVSRIIQSNEFSAFIMRAGGQVRRT